MPKKPYKIIISRCIAVFIFSSFFIFTARPAAESQLPPPAAAEPVVKAKEVPVGDPLKQKVTLDYRDTELATILRSFSYTYGLNLVTSTEVKGKITVSLQDVTLAEALDVVLGTNGYNYTRKGNIIYVTPGATEGAQLVSEPITLNYLKAGDAQNLLRKALSPKGDIKVDDVFNILVVTDYPANIEKLKFLLESVDRPPQQVLIEAKIVEITSKDLQNLGVTWQIDYSPGVGMWGRASSYPEQMKGTGTFPGTSASLPAGQFRLDTFILKGLSATATIDALIQDQKANLLASPSIAVLNNREARIIIGEKVPYKERTQTTTGTTETTKFVDVGTTLRVIPSINTDGYITMTIHPEVSSVTAILDAGPRITTREADTMVRVKEGETVVIGGLIKQEDNSTNSRTPILGFIPFIGSLFGSRSKDQSQTELTVFITPKILRSREEMYKEGRNRYQEEAFVNILTTGRLNLQKQMMDRALNLEYDAGLESRRKESWQTKTEAVNLYENILSQFPDEPKAAEAGFRAARIYYQDMNEPYRARELCAIVISTYPNDPYSADAKELYKTITIGLEKERFRKMEKDRDQLIGRRAGREEESAAEQKPQKTPQETEYEQHRKAAEELRKKSDEEAARQAQADEVAAKAKEEAARKAKQDAERKAKEDQLRKAKAEADAAKKSVMEEVQKKEQLKRLDENIAKEQLRQRVLEDEKLKLRVQQEARLRARLREQEEKRSKEAAQAAAKAKEDEKARAQSQMSAAKKAKEKAEEEMARNAKIKLEEAKRAEAQKLEERRKRESEAAALKARADQKIREEQERKAKERAEAEQKLEAEQERKAKVEEQAAEEIKAEKERKAKEQADAAREAKAESERKARAEAERKAKVEALAENKAKEQARLAALEQKTKEERARAEAERGAQEKAEQLKQIEAEQQKLKIEQQKQIVLLKSEQEKKAREQAEAAQKRETEQERKTKVEAQAAEKFKAAQESKVKEQARQAALEQKKKEERARAELERRAKEKTEQLKQLDAQQD
ncbi:MAG: secretin N-terminal domain-containing protein, partial [Candidatus Omnitrophota bacterium]|nr:secretin N-terminal domain-containing protein [Candidatus Omnitrophota bacterium]